MRDASARNSSEHRWSADHFRLQSLEELRPRGGGTHGLLCPAGALCIPDRTEAAGRPLPSTLFLVVCCLLLRCWGISRESWSTRT